MNPIHPKKILILLLLVQGLLLLLVFFASDFSFVKFPKLSNFIEEKTNSISPVKSNQKIKSQILLPKEVIAVQKAEETSSFDTVVLPLNKLVSNSVLPEEMLIHPVSYENGMMAFYNKLMTINKDKSLVRIMHFGDSQIEGDRISDVLRANFQQSFGGCGVGFLPISENGLSRKNLLKEHSGWNKYQGFGEKTFSEHNGYGIAGYYHNKSSAQDAWIKFKSNKAMFSRVKQAEVLNLLYGNLNGESFYQLKSNSILVQNGVLNPVSKVSMESWEIKNFRNNEFLLNISGESSPDIYGISLDCKQGIALDNMGMRGSAGTDFTKMNKVILKEQFNKFNVGLIIYQFGVNVIPHEVGSYKYYENLVYAQLKLLKELAPDASILVVSVSDMSKKTDGVFASYSNILLIKQAQKNAALRANCVFWDLHQFMGGENSMISWVNSQPALAEKDYTHFTNKGARIVGKKLYDVIIADFIKYKSSIENN